MKKVDSIDLSNYIVLFFENVGDFISNKKLQKMLYYIQAWHIVYFDKNTLFNNKPEAWVHGPVYSAVYQHFKKFKSNPLKVDYSGDINNAIHKFSKKLDISEDQKKLIEAVLLKYGSMSAYELEVLSHSEKPWLEQRKGLSTFDRSESKISFDTMYKYYSSLIK